MASGARTVVFRVSGTITLNSHIYIGNPYLSIAGQTAPGGGILLRGSKTASANSLSALLYVETHDVVLQYLRMRLGVNPNFHELEGKDVVLADNCRDIIVDHCSFSWAQDKDFLVWPYTTAGAARNITMQWNIFSEPIYVNGVDGTGLLIGGNSTDIATATTNIDVHHNLFVSDRHRTPLFKAKNVQIVSNLVYNWDAFSTGWEAGATIDIVSNKYKPGPVWSRAPEIAYRPDGDRAVLGNPSVYIAGNVGPSNADPAGDNWKMIEVRPAWSNTGQTPSLSFRRTSRQAAPTFPITVNASTSLETVLLPEAGASKRLDANGAWVSNRDSVDTRVVQNYWSGSGTLISNESQVGGYPVIASGTPYADSDGDGMPDAWESSHGLNPNNAADGAAVASDGSGFTNLVKFLNGPTSGGVVPPPVVNPDSDGDGIPDAKEGGTTPYVVGVDDRTIDTDKDGVSNAAEYAAGTDPRVAPTTPPVTPPPTPGLLPAFPGAQGFGAETIGGRGGRVIEVTNLNDSGAGSFREACLATGARIIVFRVGGTITLNSRLSMTSTNSFVTIAGQTAPGGGVQIKGADVILNGTHDVVIRHMRFRPSDSSSTDANNRNALTLYGDSSTNKCYNVLVDHCSINWGAGDNAAMWDYVENVTWERCIFEGVSHNYSTATQIPSYALLAGTAVGNGSHLKNVTVHHSYLVNSAQRNPLLASDGPHHLINNVIYNWQSFGTNIQNNGAGTAVNLIGNFYKRGPASDANRYAIGMDHVLNPNGFVYVSDNIGPFRPTSAYNDWAIIGSGYDTTKYWTTPAAATLRRTTPWPASPIPVTVVSSSQVVAQVLNDVGATLPSRDSVDLQLVNNYSAGTGAIKLATAETAAWWPALAAGTAPVDTDHDGMPDSWETQNGLNPKDATDGARDADGDGYSNVEEFLNKTNPKSAGN
ncbi:MAG: uncharacterized protein JWL90_1148 [Chthoniobacteraceae bacterium]|nr:uncharacterized protein [Chthoniobacteraceae bacterium]